MPMPLTQSGGTKATAIATPAIEFDKCLRVIENEPATAAAMAMPRSIRFGDVRPVISDCTWLMPSPQLSNDAVPITANTPKPTVTAERRINFPSLTAKPKAKLRMGSINGATIMAPMTTAVLLEISPRVAITAELIRRMKKPSDGLDDAIRAS